MSTTDVHTASARIPDGRIILTLLLKKWGMDLIHLGWDRAK
jgi:hypothetical protein